MQAFYLDHDPALAAQALCDQHVVKMPVEVAQVLSTAARLTKPSEECGRLYRATHEHHPVTRAVLADSGYRVWLCQHGVACCEEYTHRFGKVHAALAILHAAAALLGITEVTVAPIRSGSVPLVMPEDLHSEDAVWSYRAFYTDKLVGWADRESEARYTRRLPPCGWTG